MTRFSRAADSPVISAVGLLPTKHGRRLHPSCQAQLVMIIAVDWLVPRSTTHIIADSSHVPPLGSPALRTIGSPRFHPHACSHSRCRAAVRGSARPML